MRWVRITAIVVLVFILVQGISTAYSNIVYTGIVRTELPQKISFPFFKYITLLKPDIKIVSEAPVPTTTSIEEISRLQNIVGRCI